MGVSFKGYLAIAELLIESGADLNKQHSNGGTALMFATMYGRNEIVKILLVHGAKSDICDFKGLTAYEIAVQQNNKEAMQLLT